MKVEIPVDTACTVLDTGDIEQVKLLEMKKAVKKQDKEKIIKEALQHPIGSLPLNEIVHPKEKVVIVTSDSTRPFPTQVVLPYVVEELINSGISKDDITVMFAIGSHRHLSEQERKQLAGVEVSLVDSEETRMRYVGTTARGTPVEVDERLLLADRVIVMGNVEYHYFAGFSGGAKAIVPGCASHKTIAANHSWMTHVQAQAGVIRGNPVREDIEEAASMVKVDFIVNVVLNTEKEIVTCYAGDVTEAHRKAVLDLKNMYACPILHQYDIVVVADGGYPKDRNLYQTQKALANAIYAIKEGGTIILVGGCREGYGNPVFETWMKKYHSPDEMICEIQKHFVLGGHKAVSFAKAKKKADLYLVSSGIDVSDTFIKGRRNLQDTFDEVIKCKNSPSVLIMPHGGSTLPVIRNN